MKTFIEKLRTTKIAVKILSGKGIPYHSRYIATVKVNLLANLKKVIPERKPRSRKWLSTSVLCNQWSTSSAQFSSAEYFTNNILRPVLFEETSLFVPNSAICIDIAPYRQLQELIGQSWQTMGTNISLNLCDPKDNLKSILQGLGKLYNVGLQLDLAKLYPSVKYPVSRGTPMISPLVRWEHSYDWYIANFKLHEKLIFGKRMVAIAIVDEDFRYIEGHVIDGRNLFPAAGYLCLIWETFGMMMGQLYTEISIVMENVKFNRATIVPKVGKVEMMVMIQKGSGKFEVVEGGATIVTGKIRIAMNLSKEMILNHSYKRNFDKETEELEGKDIYKEFKLRGYQYKGLFRSIRSASVSREKGHIEWKGNWVAYIDNIFQMKIFNLDTRDLFVPTGIQKLVIDTNAHQQYLQNVSSTKKYIPVQFFKNVDMIAAVGVEIHKLRISEIAKKRPISDPVIEEYKFTAYRDKKETSLREILTLSVHITLENIPMIKMKTIELVTDEDNISTEKLVSPMILDILKNSPLVEADVNILVSRNKLKDIPKHITVLEPNMVKTGDTTPFAIGYGLLKNGEKDSLKKLLRFTKNAAFLLSREKKNTQLDLSILQKFQLRIVLEKCTFEESWILLKKINKIPEQTMIKEPGGNIFRAVLIQDLQAPKFSLKLPLFSKQLETDLVTNVLRPGNIWGSYRHQLLPSREPKLTYHAIINQVTRGDLSTIRWIEGVLVDVGLWELTATGELIMQTIIKSRT
ncbi:hypothetical protein HZH66_003607 [Vespula vulgaris]|uniref:PKS/mFAS DH domain-containing protein n=1 Tax=Vespula vulgaris TaxID=7454 RepID=A0A834KIK5_VESVU|nr:hypothetical protein HZH66_003607 [Vespula vulgaris]